MNTTGSPEREAAEAQLPQWHGSAFGRQQWVGPNTMTILRDGTLTVAPDFDQGAHLVEKDGDATVYRDRRRRVVSRQDVVQALVDAKQKPRGKMRKK